MHTSENPLHVAIKRGSRYDVGRISEGTFEGFDYSPEGRFCRLAAIDFATPCFTSDTLFTPADYQELEFK